MAPAVRFPAAVTIARAILVDGLDDPGLPVVGKIPNPRPTRFVRVLRTGGARRNIVVDEPLITVESWDVDDVAAELLAQSCRSVINAARGTDVRGVAVYQVGEAGGPGTLPDPLSNQSRYTQTFTIALRGAAP